MISSHCHYLQSILLFVLLALINYQESIGLVLIQFLNSLLHYFFNYCMNILTGEMFSYEDRRRARMFESGWRNIIVKLPSKPPPYIPCADEVSQGERERVREQVRE